MRKYNPDRCRTYFPLKMTLEITCYICCLTRKIELNMGIQGKEWLWILLAIIILFGAKKIPDLMKGIGQGVKEFKNASKGETSEPGEKSESK